MLVLGEAARTCRKYIKRRGGRPACSSGPSGLTDLETRRQELVI